MKIPLVCLALVLVPGLKRAGATLVDSSSVLVKSKWEKPVKIGPDFYQLPELVRVDSALVKRMAIDERFRNRLSEGLTVKHFEDMKRLQGDLATLELYVVPDDSQLPGMEAMLRSSQLAGDRKTQSLVLNSYALYNVQKGNLDRAAGYLKESLALREQLLDKVAVARINASLAELFELSGNYDEAIVFTTSVLNTLAARGRSLDLADCYVDLANLHCLKKSYAEAESAVLKTALAMYRGNKPGRMGCFQQLTTIYFEQKRYSEAKWYCLQAKAIAEALSDEEATVDCLVRLAAIKTRLGDQKQALADFTEAERVAAQHNLIGRLIEIKGDVGEIYRNMGDYTTATAAINEYSRLRSSFLKSGVSN